MATESSILDSLGQLSKKELRELRARATLLLGAEDGSKDASSEHALVYDKVREVLKEYGILSAPPFKTLKGLPFYASFNRGADEVLKYAATYFPDATRIERGKILSILVSSVARYVSRVAPVSPKSLCQALNSVGEAVEEDFPGYAENGLLPMIVARLNVA